ncbi:protein-glutamate methylesterase/protein-glutamine glutaminase [Curvivirga aplysinae]|uniref:protein-glutamate methylesterase/protein-glutamine glutaminase n=1 Tax=Curvivirga aplysinae TaxID=2529852 RepID=UPI0012BBAB97|nr:chemotaxis response regulator protein-glutamate methylesterase [Curvivirga aplysinae]MTI08854.1 chemotaxis response regulator protein-glutamate methylesterase [Curvivirga aplysinae]
MSKIRALIVDDSALIRQLLSSLLQQAGDIEVVGTASDPLNARQMIKELNPDVVTLDIEMPKMDGLTFLEKIMTLRPMPVVMVSSLTQNGAEATLKALEIGAVDYFGKPTIDLEHGLLERAEELIVKVRNAAGANVKPLPRPIKDAAEAQRIQKIKFSSTEKIITIGASTGGVEALKDVITALPANAPAVLVTQHMPAQFTKTFAERLDGMSVVKVKEAEAGERVLPGHVYIAPGDRHLTIGKSGGNYICKLNDGSEVSGHKPSVDVLFDSAAETCGDNCISVILTGMGRDGAKGMLAQREAGAATIGQDEASCVVYGMPKAAFELGAVERQITLKRVTEVVLKLCSERGGGDIRV